MSDIVKIAVIDHNSCDLLVTAVERKEIVDATGDYNVDLIIVHFNHLFKVDLKESEISWREVKGINMY